MAKKKREREEKKVATFLKNDSKRRAGKRLRNVAATAAICATAFGAYYSPDFRTVSSGWLNRLRDAATAKRKTDAAPSVEGAIAATKERDPLEAPSFRDFLTAEYGEDGARELLRSDDRAAAEDAIPAEAPVASEVAPDTSFEVPSSAPRFADYVSAEDAIPAEAPVASEVAPDAPFEVPSSAPRFADYVSAEDAIPAEAPVASEVAPDAPFEVPSSAPRFADYVAAEDADAPLSDATPGGAERVAAKPNWRSIADVEAQPVEKTNVALTSGTVATLEDGESETALAALRDEMEARGVDAPRIERWGGRFWRASGYAATREGVAAYCEAVDVDPTAAQRAALEKFDAAKR